MRWIILPAALGLAGCVATVSEPGICAGLKRPVDALASAMLDAADQTPKTVGEAGTDVVLGFRAGCQQ